MGDILHKKSWSNKPNKLIQPRSHTIHNAFKHSYYSEKCCNKQTVDKSSGNQQCSPYANVCKYSGARGICYCIPGSIYVLEPCSLL